MKAGDLVSVDDCCGGPPGGLKCKTALIIDVDLSHVESYQSDSHVYSDRDVYQCTLFCKCGVFEEYDYRLGLIIEV